MSTTGTSTAELKNNYVGLRMLPLPILIIFTLAFNVGMGSLTWVVATEILPVRYCFSPYSGLKIYKEINVTGHVDGLTQWPM